MRLLSKWKELQENGTTDGENKMSDAGKMLVTMMMLGSMIAGNEFKSQPVDFDLMDEEFEKPDADIEPIIEAEGAEE